MSTTDTTTATAAAAAKIAAEIATKHNLSHQYVNRAVDIMVRRHGVDVLQGLDVECVQCGPNRDVFLVAASTAIYYSDCGGVPHTAKRLTGSALVVVYYTGPKPIAI